MASASALSQVSLGVGRFSEIAAEVIVRLTDEERFELKEVVEKLEQSSRLPTVRTGPTSGLPKPSRGTCKPSDQRGFGGERLPRPAAKAPTAPGMM
jgi:hypothetical protein